MKPVTIYTTRTCGYCRMVKQLLARKGVAFEEIDVTFDDARRAEMTAKAGGPACRRSGSARCTSAAATSSTSWSTSASSTRCWRRATPDLIRG